MSWKKFVEAGDKFADGLATVFLLALGGVVGLAGLAVVLFLSWFILWEGCLKTFVNPPGWGPTFEERYQENLQREKLDRALQEAGW